MKSFLKHFIIWFVLYMALYYFYISSMAQSLGIPDRSIQAADILEGAVLSSIAALVTTGISLLVKKLINRK